MKSFFRTLIATVSLAATSFLSYAQASSPTTTDTARILLPANLITAVNLQSYAAFRTAVQPLIRQMAGKKIVAMGEGTHGTAEFYKARFWLTRILVEEHGFNQLALENTYGDTYRLNEALQSKAVDIKPVMRRTLLGIWQNQEMAQVFAWMQARNRTHRQKVTLTGLDAMFSSADAELLQKGLATAGRTDLQGFTTQLLQSSQYKDNAWRHLDDSTYKVNYKELFPLALAGYEAADKLLKALPTVKLSQPQRVVLTAAATNARMAFDEFYQQKVHKRGSSRDSSFAEMARLLTLGTGQRLIIWAHDAHVARQAAFAGDSNGGGTGAFLERLFPGQYFVLATSTATGTFTATTNRFISPVSPMAAYPLPLPKAGSWEASLAQVSNPNFYFFTQPSGPFAQVRPFRLPGQTIGSENTYAEVKLSTAFDAVLFLRQTTAATPLLP